MEITQKQRDAEATSKFVRGQIVVAIFPTVQLITRVVGWNADGKTLIAVPIEDDPHQCQRSWSEADLRTQVTAEDWVTSSPYHGKWQEGIEVKISFLCDPSGFGVMRPRKEEATLISPHLRKGDWVIQYGPDGLCRVLNEKEMIPS